MDCEKIRLKLDMIESCAVKMKGMLDNGNLGREWSDHAKYIEDSLDEIETELLNALTDLSSP